MDDQRTNGERGAISLVVALISGALTYICYGFAGIMLYRQRLISEAMLWDSDFFGLLPSVSGDSWNNHFHFRSFASPAKNRALRFPRGHCCWYNNCGSADVRYSSF